MGILVLVRAAVTVGVCETIGEAVGVGGAGVRVGVGHPSSALRTARSRHSTKTPPPFPTH